MESTTGYTFTPYVGYLISPGIDTGRSDRDQLMAFSIRKALAKWGKGNCQSFQPVPVGFEPETTRS